MLPAWLPVPTLTKTTVLFFSMSIIFLAIGIPMALLSNQIVEVRIRYDNVCTINTNCTLNFSIPTTMQSPVFLYYELTNYYQNHRLYTSSVSAEQLAGSQLTVFDVHFLQNRSRQFASPLSPMLTFTETSLSMGHSSTQPSQQTHAESSPTLSSTIPSKLQIQAEPTSPA